MRVDKYDPDASFTMRVWDKLFDLQAEGFDRLCRNLFGITPEPPEDEGWLERILATLPNESHEVQFDFDECGRLRLRLEWCGADIVNIQTDIPIEDFVEGPLPVTAMRQAVTDFVTEVRRNPWPDVVQAELTREELEWLTRHETLEESDFWASLDTIHAYEYGGVPHHLWLEWLDNRDIGKPITPDDLDELYSSEVP